MKISEDRIKARLLYNLRRKKVIGGVHTHFDTSEVSPFISVVKLKKLLKDW